MVNKRQHSDHGSNLSVSSLIVDNATTQTHSAKRRAGTSTKSTTALCQDEMLHSLELAYSEFEELRRAFPLLNNPIPRDSLQRWMAHFQKLRPSILPFLIH
jgi:hypothetical protein